MIPRRVRRVATKGAVAGVAAGLLAGCASVRPREGFDDVDRMVSARTGARAYWAAGTAADSAAADTVRALLASGLTAERAVRIALLANRDLQATYEELGVARADVVQAGLVSNPVVSLARIMGGQVGEFGIAQSFVDLLQRPMRKRLAASAFEAAKLRVADEVFRHTAEVRTAYYELLAAEQTAELRRTIAQSAAASARAAQAIHTAGNLPDIGLAGEQALAEQARVDLVQADAEVAVAREHLVQKLGVAAPGSALRVAERLPALPGEDLPADSLVALAVASRLDLAAAFQDVQAAGRALGLTRRFRLLPDGALAYEGETEDRVTRHGPGLSIPLPLFDRGQAATAAAQARFRQAVARHDARAIATRSEVRAAVARLAAARARAGVYRARIVPLRHRVLQETQLQYNAMAVGVFGLLQAKQGEIDAGRGYVESLRDYWTARVELERAVGAALPIAAAERAPATETGTADVLRATPDTAPDTRERVAVPAVVAPPGAARGSAAQAGTTGHAGHGAPAPAPASGARDPHAGQATPGRTTSPTDSAAAAHPDSAHTRGRATPPGQRGSTTSSRRAPGGSASGASRRPPAGAAATRTDSALQPPARP